MSAISCQMACSAFFLTRKIAISCRLLAFSQKRCRFVQTSRSHRNVVPQDDCECHAKRGDNYKNAPQAPPISPLLKEGGR